MGGNEPALSGHALAETYSVLTRMPGDARLSGPDAARLLDVRFTAPLKWKRPRQPLSIVGKVPEVEGHARCPCPDPTVAYSPPRG
nr:hypothetical protein [Frankia sp. AgKG'84/4]